MYFWDYGNAFLLEAGRAGADIYSNNTESGFKYPSYVEDIMGPICFDYGFGPFRWVCSSGNDDDLAITDEIASRVLRSLADGAPSEIKGQYFDNIRWIETANDNGLVVGSKARILYADERGRVEIAQEFNKAISEGRISSPIILGRDHHDVSGTDSPYRETANIRDGSMFTADMSVQNFIGDSFRGATWVSLHNGGGEAGEKSLMAVLEWLSMVVTIQLRISNQCYLGMSTTALLDAHGHKILKLFLL